MIASASLKTPTVAIGHGRVLAPELTWQDARALTEQYLFRTHTEDYARNAAYQFKHLMKFLPASPGSTNPADVVAIAASAHGGTKVIFGHVVMALIESGAWRKEMLPRDINREMLEHSLAPEWRRLTASFMKALAKRRAPRECFYYWGKWASMFLWHAELPVGQKFDGVVLRQKWSDFAAFIKPYTRRATGSMLDRAFASIWNHAIDEGLLDADKLQENLIAASFWSLLLPKLREALSDYHRGGEGVPADSVWLYSLRYALCVMGFSVHAEERTLQVLDSEIEALRVRLTSEKFSKETISRVCGEVAQIFGPRRAS